MSAESDELERMIVWNRRARCYLAAQKWWRKVRAAILGIGLSYESPGWNDRVTLNGRNAAGESAGTTLSGCPVCAALVPKENRAFHERWHLTGSIDPEETA